MNTAMSQCRDGVRPPVCACVDVFGQANPSLQVNWQDAEFIKIFYVLIGGKQVKNTSYRHQEMCASPCICEKIRSRIHRIRKNGYLCFTLTSKTTNIMFTIQANPSGTRTMEISEEHLKTIEKYALFQHLIDSNGIVDESVLDKLKLNMRSLIVSSEGNCKDLLDLCIDVIYHNNMKAFGLYQLIQLYIKWQREQEGSLSPELLNEPLN